MASSLTFRRQRGFEKPRNISFCLSVSGLNCVSTLPSASAPVQMWFPLLSQLSKSSVFISVSSCPQRELVLQSLPLYLFSHCLSSTCYFQTVFKSAQIFSSLTSLPGLPVLASHKPSCCSEPSSKVHFF